MYSEFLELWGWWEWTKIVKLRAIKPKNKKELKDTLKSSRALGNCGVVWRLSLDSFITTSDSFHIWSIVTVKKVITAALIGPNISYTESDTQYCPHLIQNSQTRGQICSSTNTWRVYWSITVALQLWDFSGDMVDTLQWPGKEVHHFSIPCLECD